METTKELFKISVSMYGVKKRCQKKMARFTLKWLTFTIKRFCLVDF